MADLIRPPGLEDHEPGEGLQGVVAAVNEVTHEDIVGVGGRAALPGNTNVTCAQIQFPHINKYNFHIWKSIVS